MGILALDERLLHLTALAVLFTAFVAVIHGAEHIGLTLLACLLVLYGAAVVDGLHCIVRLLEIGAVTGLVAQAPEDDAGMVFLHQHIVLVALNMCLLVGGVLGQCAIAIAHAMALDIGLGHYIEAVDVAQVIPAGVVAVVAGAHGIHIEFFHHTDILNHTLHAHHVATIRIQFMTVHTLEVDGLAVHPYLAVLLLNLAEAHVLGYLLQLVALAVEERSAQLIQVGHLGRPLAGILHLAFHARLGLGLCLGSPHLATSGGVDEGHTEGSAGRLHRIDAYGQLAIAVVIG